LLEYVIADKQVYILWVSNQEVNMTVQALPKDSLNRQIARLHRNLSHYEEIRSQYQRVYEEYVRLGHWFYVQLLQPVLSKSQGLEHLIIIPDGELSNLPFEAFLTEAPKPGLAYAQMPYLLRQYRISYSYSAGLWQENRQQGTKANNGQILAMAPSYPPADSLVFRAFRLPSHRLLRQKLSPLPSAKAEVLALSKLFAGHFAFDSLATEYQFKQGAERYAVIHLALHGLLDNQKPLLSALAFTEDGDSLENNLLQAYEISQMRFQANLVVLSACETGFGRFEQGNGTASLARAFMYAGLPALVVSLWQVNDASTAFIMEQFYRNLDQGMDKAKALQEAKLSYLQYYDDPQAAHPAFWASFIQLGDSSPIALQRKSSYWWWVWVGAAALLSFLGWLGWKRRR
jgi:LPXTG-motif cell wall-anchored protein